MRSLLAVLLPVLAVEAAEEKKITGPRCECKAPAPKPSMTTAKATTKAPVAATTAAATTAAATVTVAATTAAATTAAASNATASNGTNTSSRVLYEEVEEYEYVEVRQLDGHNGTKAGAKTNTTGSTTAGAKETKKAGVETTAGMCSAAQVEAKCTQIAEVEVTISMTFNVSTAAAAEALGCKGIVDAVVKTFDGLKGNNHQSHTCKAKEDVRRARELAATGAKKWKFTVKVELPVKDAAAAAKVETIANGGTFTKDFAKNVQEAVLAANTGDATFAASFKAANTLAALEASTTVKAKSGETTTSAPAVSGAISVALSAVSLFAFLGLVA